LLDRGLDQPVLVDPREALELGGGDDRQQVVPGAVFVGDLDAGAGQRRLDHAAQLLEVDRHRQPASFSPTVSSISSTRTNLTRGRPCGSPRPTSASSIACQSSKVTYRTPRSASSSSTAAASGRSGSSSVPAAASASRCCTVSRAHFLFVPMTPEGPRLIQPAV